MQRALLGCTAIALGATPIGVFLIARRMSLIGDAMAHAILPGAAVGFVMCGLSLGAMTLGGSIAGLLVAVLTGAVSRATRLQEDASLAAFYLISLALGVLLVSLKGSNVDLMHVLFGSVLALDDDALLLLCTIATLTVIVLAMLYRPLVLECVDPQFLRTVGRSSLVTHQLFLALVVLNLVAGFQALGTLMAVGIMILPAATARFWARRLAPMLLIALAVALLASVTGLLLSYRFDLPSGPTIILAAGTLYLLSLLLGPEDSLAANAHPRAPRDAAGESP
ncbi:zinc ABC transporter permease [Xanthomonas prunicola]|uniref:Zinc ABC transporter permease n=2 Tax=Xanthomonas prunicola TaxID=2053930 RepID=A0A2N3RK67_9XANT|nr:zinc ABC transporter permease [Xanthomonas prunicola]PKV17175.1 zinc ABC transporter permease [Xanthomonas prunicola]PKV21069.1 zinc ABC transporter permease [Xanthomonas prunicola]